MWTHIARCCVLTQVHKEKGPMLLRLPEISAPGETELRCNRAPCMSDDPQSRPQRASVRSSPRSPHRKRAGTPVKQHMSANVDI